MKLYLKNVQYFYKPYVLFKKCEKLTTTKKIWSLLIYNIAY